MQNICPESISLFRTPFLPTDHRSLTSNVESIEMFEAYSRVSSGSRCICPPSQIYNTSGGSGVDWLLDGDAPCWWAFTTAWAWGSAAPGPWPECSRAPRTVAAGRAAFVAGLAAPAHRDTPRRSLSVAFLYAIITCSRIRVVDQLDQLPAYRRPTSRPTTARGATHR